MSSTWTPYLTMVSEVGLLGSTLCWLAATNHRCGLPIIRVTPTLSGLATMCDNIAFPIPSVMLPHVWCSAMFSCLAHNLASRYPANVQYSLINEPSRHIPVSRLVISSTWTPYLSCHYNGVRSGIAWIDALLAGRHESSVWTATYPCSRLARGADLSWCPAAQRPSNAIGKNNEATQRVSAHVDKLTMLNK